MWNIDNIWMLLMLYWHRDAAGSWVYYKNNRMADPIVCKCLLSSSFTLRTQNSILTNHHTTKRFSSLTISTRKMRRKSKKPNLFWAASSWWNRESLTRASTLLSELHCRLLRMIVVKTRISVIYIKGLIICSLKYMHHLTIVKRN